MQPLASLDLSSNPHVKLISKICLSTAARWSEAEELTLSQVKPTMIEFARTKSGKTRGIPIDEHLYKDIVWHIKTHKREDRIFDYSISAFREAIERSGIVLPDGQMTHVLRHTYASHHMQGNGNILTLQRILAHPRACKFSNDHAICTYGTRPLTRSDKAKPFISVDTSLTVDEKKELQFLATP